MKTTLALLLTASIALAGGRTSSRIALTSIVTTSTNVLVTFKGPRELDGLRGQYVLWESQSLECPIPWTPVDHVDSDSANRTFERDRLPRAFYRVSFIGFGGAL
jgi:hypothetical protein